MDVYGIMVHVVQAMNYRLDKKALAVTADPVAQRVMLRRNYLLNGDKQFLLFNKLPKWFETFAHSPIVVRAQEQFKTSVADAAEAIIVKASE